MFNLIYTIDNPLMLSFSLFHESDVRKKLTLTFEAFEASGHPVTCRTFSFTKNEFDVYMLRQHIIELVRADDQAIALFYDDLEDGGCYRAVTDLDAMKNRYQVDDQVLEIESSHYLVDALRPTFTTVHLYQNLVLYTGNTRDSSAQFDAVIHGATSGNTFAVVLEAKYNVHPDDIKAAKAKAVLFESYLAFPSLYSCTSGYDRNAPKIPFDHYSNIKKVVPCLAGIFFPPELVEICKEEGVIPIYPSGARYTGYNLELLHNLTRT